MSGDEPILTNREERAAIALRAALHEIAAGEPFRVNRDAFAASAPRERVLRGHLPAGLAAALAVVLIAGLAVVAAPRLGIVGSGTTRTHFDNGQFAFDYPAAWQTLATRPGGDLPVLGTGKYSLGCPGQPSATGCGEEITDISGGGIVVTMWVDSSGPPASCVKEDALSAAPLGDAWIRRYDEDARHATQPTTRWEIRRPGYDFGMNGNLWIQAVTDNPAELANAEAMVATFHWEAAGDYCQSPTAAPTLPGTAAHFDDGQFSFDYPAGWRVLASDYPEGIAVQVDAVLGTGSWQSGCRVTDNGGSCTGDTVDVGGGRVVVKVWRRVDGPVNGCMGNNQATATFGPNAVFQEAPGLSVDWQIRVPGAEFQWAGNVDVQVWADGPSGLAQAQALVASFRWAPGVGNAAGNCAPIDTLGPPTFGPGPS